MLVAVFSLAACSRPAPRSFDFFLEDPFVRDGVIARCDAHPIESQRDIECANARRAATAEQLRIEHAKREELERASARKLEALRREYAQREAEAKAAAAAAAGQVSAAAAVATPEQPAFGAPLQPPVVDVPSVGPAPKAPAAEDAAPPVAAAAAAVGAESGEGGAGGEGGDRVIVEPESEPTPSRESTAPAPQEAVPQEAPAVPVPPPAPNEPTSQGTGSAAGTAAD